MFRVYQRAASKMWRVFTLTLDDFVSITSRPCFYCGETVKQRGIDRMDNSKDYILSNCLPCCKTCNQMKHKLNVMDFIDKAKQIAERHKHL